MTTVTRWKTFFSFLDKCFAAESIGLRIISNIEQQIKIPRTMKFMLIVLARINKVNMHIQEIIKQIFGDPACIPPLNFLIVINGRIITMLSKEIFRRLPIVKLSTSGKNEMKKHDAAYSYNSHSSCDMVFAFTSRWGK